MISISLIELLTTLKNRMREMYFIERNSILAQRKKSENSWVDVAKLTEYEPGSFIKLSIYSYFTYCDYQSNSNIKYLAELILWNSDSVLFKYLSNEHTSIK